MRFDDRQQRAGTEDVSPSPDAIRIELEKTLASNAFVSSPQLCRFLRYVVEQEILGRGEDLKEYTLALEVFRRDQSFDPRVDTVVRTEARRLRQKLLEYYQREGREDPIEIVLPKGAYRAVFQLRFQTTSQQDFAQQAIVPPRVTRVWVRWAAVAVVTFIVIAGIGWSRWTRTRPTSFLRPSIAVLSFENLSGDSQQEYFVAGMTDAIFTDLARIHGLSVISRTSVMRYAETKKTPIPEIARQLKVDYVLAGSVTRAGDRVRILAQLIAGPEDRHVWAESYERSSHDVFQLQGEIARAIATQINIHLSPQEQARLAAGQTVSPEAHDLYLLGRFNWQTRELERLEKSIPLFQQAIAKEPTYALAWAGLADSYSVLANRTDRADLNHLACQAAKKAIELNENLGEAQAQVAVSCFDGWDWSAREQGLRRAIELSPGYATARHWYGATLIDSGRFEEGLSEMRRAAELDPFSPIVMVGLGWAFFVTGNYDQAITRNRQTLEIFPNSVQAYLHLGMALAEKGMFGQAIEVLEKASSITSGAPPVAAVLAHVRARAGDSRPARLLLEDLKKRKDVTPILFGLLYMDIGDRDRAFEWFNRAVEQRSMFSDEIMVEPMYRPLHSDPRWPALLKKMNLGN